VSWFRAANSDLEVYSTNLSCLLSDISIPVDAALCCNLCNNNLEHVSAISLSTVCRVHARPQLQIIAIPHSADRSRTRRIAGWSERIKPLREKSIFWHCLRIDCSRSRSGVVADCMRRTRAAYHYAIRQVCRDENIVHERIVEALLKDPTRKLWEEVKRFRNKKTTHNITLDGCTDDRSLL